MESIELKVDISAAVALPGSVAPPGSVASLTAAAPPGTDSASPAGSGGFLRRWLKTNQLSPTTVITSAMKKFSRRPRMYWE